MKVLVTGASGFLGGALVRRIVADGEHEVHALVRPSSDLRDLRAEGVLDAVTLVHGDLTDGASLRAAVQGMDVVVHSAARVDERGTRSQFVSENLDATVHLLDAARESGVGRFVYISSPSAVMEYDGGDLVNVDESVPYPARYLNLYSETKAAAERAVLAADAPGFVTCALRPRAIWGAGDRSGPVVRLLGRAAAGRLPDLSGGRAVQASLCHVDNAVDAVIRAWASDRVGGRAYFLADDEITDVWQFVGVLADRFGFDPPSRRPNPRVLAAAVTVLDAVWSLPPVARRWSPPLSRYVLALLGRTATFDTTAARRDFGYRPVVGRDEGLAAFGDWVDTQGGIESMAGAIA
ncbi:NAD-dependent epimerase/dehydratase family protein [Rhodococcus triatomae]|uniref:Nucleoside-diphosphate-sugar epimerase n=1 Tax=Rhodococcus triatomae TaxID=300028 RepID=A0A1G8L6H3_9NOCA|nr:NAD-dependent epimerase/dehydratase family protein [Rhodococcus triatomae]QNG20518.1 NAD-dependent epimerase/dehydratase family protein [Rhodococcus triatomae]QNG23564.1 NAD-dependent epimerase/dehydratase family protein [Rhodococcus triatomae]SDI51286.1 Nucleoside-diphosphate-sugar epimerase [Rhodococcus triatomae]